MPVNTKLALLSLALLAVTPLQGQARQDAAVPAPGLPGTPDPALPQVSIGPVQPWISPIALTAPESKGGAVLRLFDVQIRTDAKGMHEFQRSIIKFNTPASLQMATNLTLQWQPAFGGVTVNAARIHRDGQVIDLLAQGGKFTALRQEAQLGAFQTTGALTAFMPVTGLKVGDMLEFAYTIDAFNPALGGHVEEEYFVFPGLKFDQFHLEASHLKDSKFQVRFGPALPAPKRSEAGGFVFHTADQLAVQLPKLQAGDAMRQFGRGSVQISDFASWQQVAEVMHPLFERGAALAPNSPINAEIARIAAASADPMVRASMALRLVQRQTRYFAELEGLGGYTPIPADTVWDRKIGDCKGKTVLLLALLRGLQIDAEPLLVSSKRGPGTDQVLPMPGRFDHVIILARIGGKDYWLDGTRMDGGRVQDLESPNFLWGLPLTNTAKGLVQIPADTFQRPQSDWAFEFDASAGLDVPAKAKGTAVLRGDLGQALAQAFDVLGPEDLDEMLRNAWKSQRSDLTIDTVTHELDPETGEVRIGFTGTAKLDWNRTGKTPTYRYEAGSSRIGVNLVPDRDNPPPGDEPIAVERRYDTIRETILLPDGGTGFSLDGSNIDETVGGVRYVRKASLAGNRFELAVSQASPRLELNLAQAMAADNASDGLWQRPLYLRLPPALVAKDAGSNASAANRQIEELIDTSNLVEARRQIDGRLAATPRDPDVLALSGRVRFIEGDFAGARRDLDMALAINNRQVMALHTKAQTLYEQGQFDDALLLLDRAVLINPDDDLVYITRSLVHEAAGDKEAALADRSILVARHPEMTWPRVGQTRLLFALGRGAEALVSAQELRKIGENKDEALSLLIDVLMRKGDRAAAMKELAAPGVAKQSTLPAVLRLEYGLWANPDQLLADAQLAVATYPTEEIADGALDALAQQPKRIAKLLAAYDAAARKPGAARDRIAVSRALAERVTGNSAPLAAALTALELGHPNDPQTANEVCWARAIWRIDLAAARASCEAALRPARLPAYVDSLAMVELQSGNFLKAITLYSEVLRSDPELAETRFGRGVARLSSGDMGGQADLALARSIKPDIDATFARYGFLPALIK